MLDNRYSSADFMESQKQAVNEKLIMNWQTTDEQVGK